MPVTAEHSILFMSILNVPGSVSTQLAGAVAEAEALKNSMVTDKVSLLLTIAGFTVPEITRSVALASNSPVEIKILLLFGES